MTNSLWRIKPENADRSEKFTANMDVLYLGEFPTGGTYAYGVVSNDSRNLFLDGMEVRTSKIVSFFVDEGDIVIETRNTLYRVVGGNEAIEKFLMEDK